MFHEALVPKDKGICFEIFPLCLIDLQETLSDTHQILIQFEDVDDAGDGVHFLNSFDHLLVLLTVRQLLVGGQLPNVLFDPIALDILKFLKNRIDSIFKYFLLEPSGIAEYSSKPGEVIVKVILFVDVLGKTSNDKGHIESRDNSAGYVVFPIEFFAEGDCFLKGCVESHVDAGLLVNIFSFHEW